jgi:xanthine dehydrogenase accessory factor
LKELLQEIERWLREGEQIALATLVAVQGSAPRRPGARMALTRSGRMAGSVSAGCVENDVFARALQVLEEGKPALARYGISSEAAFAVGLSCGGSIEVLIEPFAATPAWEAVRAAVEQGRAAALAVGVEPALLAGRTLAMLADGSVVGSLDAEMDARLTVEAKRALAAGGGRCVTLPWRGADATVFVEGFQSPRRLFVAGATQIAAALAKLARPLGHHVVVMDPRSPFATVERLPDAHAVLREWPDAALARAGLDAGSAVVVLSHDPKFDVPALALALRSPAYYVGALGSRRTHARRLAQLREVGLSDGELARIRAPIGLDLGGREPQEIALAIVAEIQAVRYERNGGSLSEGSGSIHAGSARDGFTSAIVLAAGRATRMGRNKALAPIGGRPMLQHVLTAAAASNVDEIVLVLGADEEAIRRALVLPAQIPTRVVVVAGEAPAQSVSLRAGLRAVDARATRAAILLGDEPGVTDELIDRVGAALADSGARAARPLWRDATGRCVPGHPVFLSRSIWPELESLRGDTGARQLFEAHPEWLHEVHVEGEPVGDVDTPEDLARADERAALR